MNDKISKSVRVVDLGLIDYQEAWDYQDSLFQATIATKINNRKLTEGEQAETPNYLLFCQHPHVYTLGKTGKPEHLLLDEDGLKKHEASYYKINRGGDITYHGPGQIVGYPVLDLENFFTDIHRYLRELEEAVILTLADYGIAAGRIEGLTGVWIDYEKQENPRKICAMGVRTSRWVTMHGLALNVNTDLGYFGHIVPCGIDDKAVTSMEVELGHKPDFNKVQDTLCQHIAERFEMNILSYEKGLTKQ